MLPAELLALLPLLLLLTLGVLLTPPCPATCAPATASNEFAPIEEGESMGVGVREYSPLVREEGFAERTAFGLMS